MNNGGEGNSEPGRSNLERGNNQGSNPGGNNPENNLLTKGNNRKRRRANIDEENNPPIENRMSIDYLTSIKDTTKFADYLYKLLLYKKSSYPLIFNDTDIRFHAFKCNSSDFAIKINREMSRIARHVNKKHRNLFVKKRAQYNVITMDLIKKIRDLDENVDSR